jgi:hypothetical protein
MPEQPEKLTCIFHKLVYETPGVTPKDPKTGKRPEPALPFPFMDAGESSPFPQKYFCSDICDTHSIKQIFHSAKNEYDTLKDLAVCFFSIFKTIPKLLTR